MSDKKIIKQGQLHDQNDETGESGTGSIGGEIQFRFRDAASIEPRDDLLTPEEKKRLGHIHKESHSNLVKKQRDTRKNYADFKAGKIPYQQRQRGLGIGQGGGGSSPFRQHPHLKKFAGKDPKVTMAPSDYDANTNPEQQESLENRLQNRYQLQNAPKFNPKPRPG
jgi:hypothetical protein